jgi:hypothetical protein
MSVVPARQMRTWACLVRNVHVTCHSMVRLTADEFDRRRAASPSSPVLATEHGRRS